MVEKYNTNACSRRRREQQRTDERQAVGEKRGVILRL